MAQIVLEEYKRNYFSGNQARVYFDNKFIAEIAYMEYSLSTNKAPIYSYNDPKFKLVALGNILVQGNFAINFTEIGYLIKMANDITTQKTMREVESADNMISTYFKGMNSSSTDPVEIVDMISSHSTKDRSAIINWYKNNLWGKGMSRPGSEFMMHPWEFDLDGKGHISNDGFTITAMFGVPGIRANMFSLKTISNVHVTSEGMSIQPTGQGLVEQYSFFGKAIDEDIINYPTIEGEVSKLPSKVEESTSTPSNSTSKPPVANNKVLGSIIGTIVGINKTITTTSVKIKFNISSGETIEKIGVISTSSGLVDIENITFHTSISNDTVTIDCAINNNTNVRIINIHINYIYISSGNGSTGYARGDSGNSKTFLLSKGNITDNDVVISPAGNIDVTLRYRTQ